MNLSSTSFVDLPEGLVADILTRLPVKTVVQSTSICRFWYSIIKKPSFISGHYSRSIVDPSNYYILFFNTFSPTITVVSDNHRLTRNPDLNFHFETHSKSRTVIGTCNGLVCLTDYDSLYRGRDIYLVNPFIHKYKKLVVDSSCYVDLIAQIDHTNGCIRVGFGYSEDENDYKVVRFLNHRSGPRRTTKAEIYSLKSQTWKCIDAPNKIPSDTTCPVSVHGCLYWCLWPELTQEDSPDGHLLCFSLKDEVYKKIKFPQVFFDIYFTGAGINMWARNGCFAVGLDHGDSDHANSMKFYMLVLENDVNDEHVVWKEFNYDIVGIKPMICMGFSVCGRLIFVDWNPIKNIVAVDVDNSCAIEKLELDHVEHFSETYVMESLVLFLD